MKRLTFTSLDLGETVRMLMHEWSNEIACRNVYWIGREVLEKIMSTDLQTWTWKADHEPFAESLGAVSPEESYNTWRLIAQMPIPRSLSHPELFSLGAKKNHILIPIIGPQSGHAIGYFLLLDIKGKVTKRKLGHLKTCAGRISPHMEFCWQYQLARDQTFIDDLTALYNQRYLPKVFEREIGRMARLQKKFSVLFLDIDYFKRVNDTRGHWTGSRLLVEVARILQKCVRTCDYAFRYGGDEFVVVLVDTTPEQGQMIAERIRQSIEKFDFLIEDVPLKLTVSIGLAVYPDNANSTVELLKLADQAMYYGKRKSRNIVFLAG